MLPGFLSFPCLETLFFGQASFMDLACVVSLSGDRGHQCKYGCGHHEVLVQGWRHATNSTDPMRYQVIYHIDPVVPLIILISGSVFKFEGTAGRGAHLYIGFSGIQQDEVVCHQYEL